MARYSFSCAIHRRLSSSRKMPIPMCVPISRSRSIASPADAGWIHDVEGPDDMPAHVKTMLTAVSLHVPVLDGALALGTWQGVYVAEHRARPHRREIMLQFIGSKR